MFGKNLPENALNGEKSWWTLLAYIFSNIWQSFVVRRSMHIEAHAIETPSIERASAIRCESLFRTARKIDHSCDYATVFKCATREEVWQSNYGVVKGE